MTTIFWDNERLAEDHWKDYWTRDGFHHYQVRIPRYYALTKELYNDPMNRYEVDVDTMSRALPELPILKAWFQMELAGRYYHWQIHLVCYQHINTQLVRQQFFSEAMYRVNMYCSKVKNPFVSYNYCTKEDTRFIGPFVWTGPPGSPKPPLCSSCRDDGCILCSGILSNALEK